MVATSFGELRADVGGRRDAGNNQQRRSGASGRVEPALLAVRTGRVLPARLALCVAGFGSPELSVMSSQQDPKQADHVPFAHLECMLVLLDRLFSVFERRVRSSIFADHRKFGRAQGLW